MLLITRYIHLYLFLYHWPWSEWGRSDSLFTLTEGPIVFLPLRFACFDFPS